MAAGEEATIVVFRGGAVVKATGRRIYIGEMEGRV